MKRLVIFVAVIVLLGASVAPALAQPACTNQNLAGTYVFQSKGSSAIAMGPAQGFLNHLITVYAPVVVVGRMTIAASGEVDGIYWAALGTSSSGPDPVVWHGQISEFADCVGIISYTIPIVGGGGVMGQVTERFVVVDSGQEVRSATIGFVTLTNPPSSLTPVWNTVARRVATANYGHQARGKWVMTCDSLHPFTTPPMPGVTHLAEAAVVRMEVASDGSFTGIFESKIGPSHVQFPITGDLTPGEDATITGEMQTPAAPGMTIIAKGVVFSEGKEFLVVPIGTWNGTTLLLGGYDSCRGIRYGR